MGNRKDIYKVHPPSFIDSPGVVFIYHSEKENAIGGSLGLEAAFEVCYRLDIEDLHSLPCSYPSLYIAGRNGNSAVVPGCRRDNLLYAPDSPYGDNGRRGDEHTGNGSEATR